MKTEKIKSDSGSTLNEIFKILLKRETQMGNTLKSKNVYEEFEIKDGKKVLTGNLIMDCIFEESEIKPTKNDVEKIYEAYSIYKIASEEKTNSMQSVIEKQKELIESLEKENSFYKKKLGI